MNDFLGGESATFIAAHMHKIHKSIGDGWECKNDGLLVKIFFRNNTLHFTFSYTLSRHWRKCSENRGQASLTAIHLTFSIKLLTGGAEKLTNINLSNNRHGYGRENVIYYICQFDKF